VVVVTAAGGVVVAGMEAAAAAGVSFYFFLKNVCRVLVLTHNKRFVVCPIKSTRQRVSLPMLEWHGLSAVCYTRQMSSVR